MLARHRAAYPGDGATSVSLPDHGRVRFRKDGEDHGWAPPVVVALQQAVKTDGADGVRRLPGEERAAGPPARAICSAVRPGTPVPLDEVEPAESIRTRFVSSAMSLGALSPEAHATLSIAMNRMGARSNSGEGGEDPHNYHGFANGDRADNRIKQVASARFGVTTEYLARAEELEIKIVQGAKPGEGGQLPAHKVTELIARLRHAVPGDPADLAAAAPRHLLDRGPGAAHPRPQDGEPARAGGREAGRARPASAPSRPAWRRPTPTTC